MASAKLIKKKKRKMLFRGYVTIFFCISLITFVASRIALKSYNYGLSIQAGNAEQEVRELRKTVSSLETEIYKLQDRDRVMAVAEKEGIKTNQEQVIIIEEEEKNE